MKGLLACQCEVQHVLIACSMDLKANREKNNVVSEAGSGKGEGGRRYTNESDFRDDGISGINRLP